MSKRFAGSCHCGAIAYLYETAAVPSDWSVRACQCTFCLAHAALSTSDPNGLVDFQVNESASLQKYRFGLMTADFLLCKNCGVYIGAAIESDLGRFGIINIQTLTESPGNIADVAPISYDDEDAVTRVSRREDRWTPIA